VPKVADLAGREEDEGKREKPFVTGSETQTRDQSACMDDL